jgi:hypothetical protein
MMWSKQSRPKVPITHSANPLAQQEVLRDEEGVGDYEREQEVSQKLQEDGHGSSGLTMCAARRCRAAPARRTSIS